MELFDTHCHIQFADYPLDPEEVIASAHASHVSRMLLVGCALPDSQAGITLAAKHDNIWASIGLHPHEADVYVEDERSLQQFRDLAVRPKVVAIGETGLDYFYNHASAANQEALLRFQLELGQEHHLPLIFHVRDAFDEFWRIFDEYKGVTGVVHSFTANRERLDQILHRGLYVGLNGIMTFTKDRAQLEAAKAVPLDKLLLETDAPFLTPKPFRGTICEPKHVGTTADFLSRLRDETLDTLASATTANAKALFNL